MPSSGLPLLALLLQVPAAPEPSQVPSYVPHRVYDTASRTFVDFETMLVAISKVDFVFVGEQHDDPATHPRWTPQNRPLIDTSNPAIYERSGRDRWRFT